MIKSFRFEPYTPGMQARLDPTFRRTQEFNALPEAEELLIEIHKDQRFPLLPFTSSNKTSRIAGRVLGIRDFGGND